MFRLPSGYRLIVGRDIEDRRELARMVRSAMLWGLGVMAVFGIGGGYWVSRKLLARIDALSDTSRTIMEGDLTGRLPVNGSGDELDRLAQSLNLMLARIEQLMAGLREVSDNIAHDLKTPLNRLRNRVEAALREPYGEPVYREALERTIEEADGLIKTFNALLSIARIEAGAGGENRESLDVSALLRDVAELYEPVAEERGLVLKADAQAPIFIRGDRQLLGQAIANLIDNAIKYGTSRGSRERPRRPARSRGERRSQRLDGRDRGDRSGAWRAGLGPRAGARPLCPTGSEPVRARQRARFEPCRGRGAAAWWQPETRGQRARAQSHPRLAYQRRGACQRGAAPSALRSRDQAGVTAFFERITEAPRVFDAARGDDALESLTQALAGAPDLAPAAERLGEAPKLRALLAATFSCSPYLTSLALRDPATLAECVLRDPDVHLTEARAELAAAVADAPSAKEVMALLRRYKRRMALLTGLADLGGVWPTETTLAAMSATADAVLQEATAFLFRKAREAGQIAAQADARAGARLFHHRHGQARRVRAELFERHRHHCLLRRRRAPGLRPTSSRRLSSCG